MSRPSALALAVAFIVLSVLDFERFRAGHEHALETAATHGLLDRRPGLASEIGRHYDPVFAELRVARALLDDELDRSWIRELPVERQRLELERGPARLEQARQVAESAWPRRPSSWEAALVLGGARYLELFRSRDPRWMSESELWERPLLAAHRLGPSQTGPVRFLAAAYLGNWSSLSPQRREAAIELITRGFEDRRTYRLLVRDWLRVAPSRSRALAAIPARPWAWQTLQEIFAQDGDQELEVLARRRLHESLVADQGRVVQEAQAALRAGEERRARYLLLTLLERLPVALEFVPALEGILETLPPGPTGAPHAASFESWLAWAFDLCLLRECPIESTALERLARLSGDLTPEQQALAALLSGDLARARRLERRFAPVSMDAWAPYLLLKAEHLAHRARPDEAAEALALLPADWRRRPRYWIARRQLAALVQDTEAEAESDRALARLGRTAWGAVDWRMDDRSARLEILAPESATGLRLAIVDVSPPGSIFDIHWNGELVAIRRTTGARAEITLDLPIEPGLHLVEIVFHSGGAARPADAALA